MDARALFDVFGLWTETPGDCNDNAWNSQDIFNITQIGFIWKKKVIYT